MEKFRVVIRGTRPLLMHAIPKSLGEKKRPGEPIDPQKEAEAGLYKDEKGNIVWPALNLISCFEHAARELRVPGKGRVSYSRYILSGLELEPHNIPLTTSEGEPPKWELDIRPVRVEKARILRARPRFDNWRLEFTLNILDPIIRPEVMKKIIEDAGKFVGIGDFRPQFGLFTLEQFEKI